MVTGRDSMNRCDVAMLTGTGVFLQGSKVPRSEGPPTSRLSSSSTAEDTKKHCWMCGWGN